MTRVLVLAGSNRTGSLNRRLATETARRLSLRESADVTRLDLSDYPLPIYDGDDEAAGGVPENALRLAERIAGHDALILVSPEYNWSVSPLLKNALDWASRVRRLGGRPVLPFRGLVVGLASVSPGAHGGIRGLMALRPVLVSLGAEVIARQFSLASGGNAFDEHGRLASGADSEALDAFVEAVLDMGLALRRTP